MGRVHKKKIAQYNKENGDGALDTSTNGDEKSSDRSRADSDAEESIASSKKRTPKSTPVPDDKVDDDEEEQIDDIDRSEEKKEDESAAEDEDKSEEEPEPETKSAPVGKKTAQKRKAGPRSTKSEAEIADEDDDAENEAEANGASPAKKSSNKKNAGKKAKAKPKSKKSKIETEDEAEADEDNAEEGEDEPEYEVKDVVDHKTEKGVSYYLIRWKGYGPGDDTWEEEATLSCQDLINKFNKKKKETKSQKAKPASKKASAAAKKTGKKASEDPEKQWEVDKIIDYSDEKKGRVFRIRWKGYSAKFDTWEPEENLNCDDLIQKFTKKIESQKDVSFKELREEPKKTKRMVSEGYLKAEKGERKSKRAGGKRIQYADSD